VQSGIDFEFKRSEVKLTARPRGIPIGGLKPYMISFYLLVNVLSSHVIVVVVLICLTSVVS